MAKRRKVEVKDLTNLMSEAMNKNTEKQNDKSVKLQNSNKTYLQKNRKTEKQNDSNTKERRKDNIEYKTIRINKELHKEVKLKAFQKGEKIADYIERLIEIGLQNDEN